GHPALGTTGHRLTRITPRSRAPTAPGARTPGRPPTTHERPHHDHDRPRRGPARPGGAAADADPDRRPPCTRGDRRQQSGTQQAKADHDFTEQELELKTNTQLTREIHTLTTELHNRLLDPPAHERS